MPRALPPSQRIPKLLRTSTPPPQHLHRLTTIRPDALAQLSAPFQRLDQGESIALLPPADEPVTTKPPGDGAWLGVTSSGSTGRPKLQWCWWADLKRAAVARPEVTGWAWASPYRPWTFAGVQVAVQAWATGGRLVSLGTDWAAAWTLLHRERVDAVSATPTYLDLLIQEDPVPRLAWEPRQITLGGEPLRPTVGTRLQARFPRCHFTVIYALAELGVLLKTHRLDGWYERESLGREGESWRVVEGVLEVRRDGQWWRTGDRVEVQGNLVRVSGRGDQVANVGGTKVSLIEVAELAEQVPGVRRAVAVAEDNPVTGQIVCLKYAADRGFAPEIVLASLQAVLRQRLRKEAWPRRWVVDEVGLGPNAKREVG